MRPILLCSCGTVTGNANYPHGADPQTEYVVKKFFQAAILGKRPSPPPNLVESYTCDRCKKA